MNRRFAIAAVALMATGTSAAPAPPPSNELLVRVTELRNTKGVVRACLTRNPASFPDCSGDAQAMKVSVPAARAGEIIFGDLPTGTYALSVIHDENGNGKLDTFAKVPREGYGFSGNPPLLFRAPRFAETDFALAAGVNRQVVRLRYLL
jgi:uncharacterized protein (DUF2141 family)